MKQLLTGVIVLLFLGCEGSSLVEPSLQPEGGPEATTATSPGEAVVAELRLDGAVSAGPLRLRWLEVDDSRCPRGVQCVWEGQVAVTIEVAVDRGLAEPIELVLRPGLEPASVVVAERQLRLVEVEPYPRDGVTPEREEYLAKVELRPV